MKTGKVWQARVCIILTLLCSNPIRGVESQGYLKDLPAFIKTTMKEWKTPGVAVGVIKDKKIIFKECFGFRDLERELPVTPDTVFGVGSISKSITAITLGVLADEGVVDFDVPVVEYVSSFMLNDDYATRHVTIRDMLSHRTGFSGHDLLYYLWPNDREGIIHRLRYLDMKNGFRDKYGYSNLMYMTAGYLAGKMMNSSWEDVVTDKVFTPLGMDRSDFFMQTSDDDFSNPYQIRDGNIRKLHLRNRIGTGPAGGINSTLDDLLKFLTMLLNRGKVDENQVISKKMLTLLLSPQIPIYYARGSIIGQINLSGLGWDIHPYKGNFLAGHGGYIEGFGTEISFMPDAGIGVVVLSNTKYSYFYAFFLKYMIYDELLGFGTTDWTKILAEYKPSEKDEDKEEAVDVEKKKKENFPSMARYAGDYIHNAYGTLKIEVSNNHLYANLNDQVKLKLEHVEDNVFEGEFVESEYIGRKFRFIFQVSKDGKEESIAAVFGGDEIHYNRK